MTTKRKTNGELGVAPEDKAIQDAYWTRTNNNPYSPGTPEYNRYEEAFTSEMERLIERNGRRRREEEGNETDRTHNDG